MFSWGNLISIGITLIIVVLYRLLDKDNRSLEKVKKYADKLQNDMSVWADQRSEDLKAYSIELGVHQQAAKEILRRVSEAEDHLSQNANQINGVADRLSEYDKALAELKDMSARVDSNLSAIHDESAFVDSVAKTLKNSHIEIDNIKKEVSSLISQAANDIRITMDQSRSDFSQEIDNKLADAEKAVNGLLKEVEEGTSSVDEINSESAHKAEERFIQIKKELDDAFVRAREEGEKLEDEAFVKLREHIDNRGTKLSEALDNKFAEIRDKAKLMISETQDLVKHSRSEIKAESEAFHNTINAENKTLKEDINIIIKAALEEAKAISDGAISNAKADVESVNSWINDSKVKLSNFIQEWKNDQDSLNETAANNTQIILEKMKAENDSIEKRLALYNQEWDNNLSTIKNNNAEQVENLKKESLAATSLALENAKAQILEEQNAISAFKESWRVNAQELQAEAEKAAQENYEKTKARIEQSDAMINQVDVSTTERYNKLEAKVVEAAKGLQEKIKDQLKAYQDDIVAKQAAVRAELKSGINETKQDGVSYINEVKILFDNAKKEFAANNADMESQILNAKNVQEEKAASIIQKIEESEKTSNDLVTNLNEKFISLSQELENKTLLDFQKRYDELRNYSENGLSRLEAIRIDTMHLEEALRNSMASVEKRIGEDFALFGKDMQTQEASFEAEFLNETAKIKNAVKDLDSDLAALKSKAYTNVSEKLKVFEDDFDIGLKNRYSEIESKLASWKIELDEKLASAMRESEATREKNEMDWATQSRASLAETQNKLLEQLEKLTTQINTHREAINERIGEADQSLVELKSSVKTDLDSAKIAANTWLNTEIERWKNESGERLHAVERQAETDSRTIDETMAEIRKAYENSTSSLQSDAEALKASFNTLLENENSIKESEVAKIEQGFKADLVAAVNTWNSEQKKFFDNSKAESESVSRDIRTLMDNVDRFRHEFSQKTTQAFEDFAKACSNMNQENERKARETINAVEASLESYKIEARNIKDSVNAEHSKFVAIMDVDRKNNEKTFEEMDKTIKNFQAQTKLFERADELKIALLDSIDSMNVNMSRLESRRAEILEMDAQYTKIKRLEDELSQKIKTFLAEKRRIDTLEDDFKKLLGISQMVDQKIASVTASNDQLTQISAEIRRLTEASEEASEKYKRIEKKSNILDSTAEAVDKNFQTITDIEKRNKNIEPRIRDMSDQVISLKQSMAKIDEWQPRLDNVLSRLESIDNSVLETEKKTDELKKARKWLAETETRFNEINSKVDKQLNLLKALAEAEQPDPKTIGKSSTIKDRENIKSLARRGMKPDEIAKMLKKSIGEVELVLEMPDVD